MKQIKVVLFSCLIVLFLISLHVYAVEEDVKVEKETASNPIQSSNTQQQSTATNVADQESSKAPQKKKSKKGIWKKLMKELKHYKDDWFGNDHWFGNSHNSLFRNDQFSDMFSNFDRSFADMRRRMNNMMKRSYIEPSLFDGHQWWEDYTNAFNSMNKKSIDSSSSSTSSSESSSMSESSDKPLTQMRHRAPISSIIRTINQDGKNELSLDVNNIPRDVFEKKDIQVKVKENSLGDLITISGEKKTENGHFQFTKSFRFPKGSLDLEKVKASLSDDGTLSVKIPRIGEPEIQERVKEISIE